MPLKIELSTVMLHYWHSQPSQGDWIVLHSMTRCTSLLYDTSGFDQGAMCTVHCALCTIHCPVKQVGLGRPSTAILSCCSPPIPPQGDANNTHNCANKSRQSHLEVPPNACSSTYVVCLFALVWPLAQIAPSVNLPFQGASVLQHVQNVSIPMLPKKYIH